MPTHQNPTRQYGNTRWSNDRARYLVGRMPLTETLGRRQVKPKSLNIAIPTQTLAAGTTARLPSYWRSLSRQNQWYVCRVAKSYNIGIHNVMLRELKGKMGLLPESNDDMYLRKELEKRKLNVLIKGFPREMSSPNELKQCVRDFIKRKLGLKRKIQFTAIIFLSKPDGQETSGILLKLKRMRDRKSILHAAKTLKTGCGYVVEIDLPPQLTLRRAELLNQMNAMAKHQRKKYQLVYQNEPPFIELKKIVPNKRK